MANKRKAHTLRIIGGHWRGRRVGINSAPGLRPTPDRIRETLFNWLAPRIDGARCLDLFAGTGALGLEALSRGAAHVTFVEADADNARALANVLATLNCRDANIIHGDALQGATGVESGYDIIFVDPPFASNLHATALATIETLAHANTCVYLEYPATQADHIVGNLPSTWQFSRNKRAGQTGYGLLCPALERS